jgi:hypothetical protein
MYPKSSTRPEKGAARTGLDRGGAGITAIAVIVALLVGVIGIFDSAAGAAPQIGQEAPDFTAVDSKGNPVTAGNPAPHPVTKPYGCSIKY